MAADLWQFLGEELAEVEIDPVQPVDDVQRVPLGEITEHGGTLEVVWDPDDPPPCGTVPDSLTEMVQTS